MLISPSTSTSHTCSLFQSQGKVDICWVLLPWIRPLKRKKKELDLCECPCEPKRRVSTLKSSFCLNWSCSSFLFSESGCAVFRERECVCVCTHCASAVRATGENKIVLRDLLLGGENL